MANVVVSEMKKWFANLSATSAICTEFGASFTDGDNLFVVIEPSNDISEKCITLIPYGGSPPTREGNRQESNIQVRLKTDDVESGLKTMQEIINTLHMNEDVCASCNGKVFAIQSSPIPISTYESGKYIAVVSNYSIKHIKL